MIMSPIEISLLSTLKNFQKNKVDRRKYSSPYQCFLSRYPFVIFPSFFEDLHTPFSSTLFSNSYILYSFVLLFSKKKNRFSTGFLMRTLSNWHCVDINSRKGNVRWPRPLRGGVDTGLWRFPVVCSARQWSLSSYALLATLIAYIPVEWA